MNPNWAAAGLGLVLATGAMAGPLVIAHRGASGYLPEHTLEAAAYAHALGADYIEQDVVLSADDVLVVIHDLHLDATTDVAARFPGRHRADGRFHVIDFTWAELRELRVRERVDPRTGRSVYPGRFAAGTGHFRLCTLGEQIELIRGLDRATGRTTGIYVEFKDPAAHRAAGKDLGRALLDELARHGYRRARDPVFVQCFDAGELRRLREELRTELRLVQLLEPDDHRLATPAGLAEIARYAQGVGPALSLVHTVDPGGTVRPTPFLADAHRAALIVHPYTVRRDALPAGVPSLEALVGSLAAAGADGFFTDHPDSVRAALP